MKRKGISPEELRAVTNKLIALQSEYESGVTQELELLLEEFKNQETQNRISSFIKSVRESGQILENLVLEMNEFVKMLNMECVYASPRGIFKS